MKLLEDHPVVKNIGVLIAFLALITMAGKAWIFLETDNARNDKWMELDEQWNADQLKSLQAIIEQQKVISAQLAAVTASVDRNSTQMNQKFGALDVARKANFQQREGRFDKLESAMVQASADLHYRIGIHAGRHMEPAHKGRE